MSQTRRTLLIIAAVVAGAFIAALRSAALITSRQAEICGGRCNA